VKCSTRTPPLARITGCDAIFSGSVVTVWKYYRGTLRLSIVEARDEGFRIGFNFCQFFLRSDHCADVVGGPSPLKGGNVACEMVFRWTDELHHGEDSDA
jgi:hypothetical protein